jgi:hypothetical protein
MDYKIKLEYSGIGKAATSARRKVIQAQKVAEKKGISPVSENKQLISSNQKLINSNKNLEKTIKTSTEIPIRKAEVPTKVPKKREGIPERAKTGEKVPAKEREGILERVKIPTAKQPSPSIPFRKVAEKKEIPPAEILGKDKQLITSIQELTKSNKNLEKTIKAGGARPGGSPARPPIPGGGGQAPGIGQIGASLPIVGAGIAALGFTIQKINQIGNAYIELAGQQLRTVGMAGFRRGQGIYGATEMGAGMAAFAKGTGRFAENIDVGAGRIKKALAIGTRYGMSAEQVLGQAGTFKRAGGRLGREAGAAVAGGMEADMPILLSGMASVLEEAIRAGIDTTDMAKDLGRGLTALAMETPAKSAEAALAIMRSFQGVKQGVAQGRVAGYEELEVAQAGRDVLMERLSDQKYVENLTKSGWISERQQKAISGLEPGASFSDLQKTIGVAGAQSLMQKTVGETKDVELLMRIAQNAQREYGTGAEARQVYQMTKQAMGSPMKQEQTLAVWNLAQKGLPKSEWAKGLEDIRKGAGRVEAGEAGIGAQRMIERQNLILKYGDSFALASRKMETALIQLADKSIGATVTAVNGLGTEISDLIGMIKTLKKSEGFWGTGDISRGFGIVKKWVYDE